MLNDDASADISFSNLPSVKTIDVTHLAVSQATDLHCMFRVTPLLETIDRFETWNTGNVTNMDSVFCVANEIRQPDGISKWNTRNVTNMRGIFTKTRSLSNLIYPDGTLVKSAM
ncbi:surface protein [Bifidobacterium bohemicum]|uniref:Lipoprotein n=1 Tax=Bifidobacterium bohemicum DSM 22767 TaxID=1437606 RepID=A0A086ZH95_9BIFI|nr:lipoprotein [Bifidobacterium bohemicum DSM 22767]SCC16550.1 surface protein [Bifidobacterium bohemicum]